MSWLVIEDPGPWGRDALSESRIPAPAADALQRLADGLRARVQLVRRHDRTSSVHSRQVIWAVADHDHAALHDLGSHDDQTLAELDVTQRATTAAPVYLVCTHARRDACCAVFGRPLVAALSAATDRPVWETSHTGGHRFAGVVIVLPWGLTYGRVDPDEVARLVAATDGREVYLPRYRGRSCDPPAAQVADVAVRQHTGVLGIDLVRATVVRATDEEALVSVDAAGRTHNVALAIATPQQQRPLSCGDADAPIMAWQVREIR